MGDLKNWIPYQLKLSETGWSVDWLDLQEHFIQEPFFDETISLCRMRMQERSKYRPQSSVDFLVEQAENIHSIQPNAFIFHISRCGSTLLSQALATDFRNVVIPEAPLLDQIIRADEQAEFENFSTERIFKAAIKFMGQQRRLNQTNYYVKLDSWHVHFYQQMREWYPTVPFYFLYREPTKVIQSHQKRRGLHAIPNIVSSKVLNVEITEAHYQNFDLYTAAVIREFYRAFYAVAKEKHPLNYFYDYAQGIPNMLDDFTACTQADIDLLKAKERLNYHSKYPDKPFEEEEPVNEHYSFAETDAAYRLLSKYLQH
ncbi:hypothetical protein [Pedobacter sp. MW01-1-1]|uniref:hypothetical protein n=1 Tax=Pedobacter sp. MW01-1-1 TaxID=3383027 RepID=UPI003FF11146